MNANRGASAHWSATVNTVTMQVMRTYMEINRDTFEKINNSNPQEEAKKEHRDKQLENKWQQLEKRFTN